MKFAAVTICKNEEHNVGQWLENTKNFDYRIVLDTGSTDKTVELFEASDVILISQTFEPFNFANARNDAIRFIPLDVDWVFWPDMDEIYNEEAIKLVEQIVENNDRVARITYTTIIYRDGVLENSTETGTITDCKIHKHVWYQWIKPIHEYLEFTSYDSTGCLEHIVHCDKIIRTHYHITNEYRSNFYFDIAKRAVEENPNDDWVLWFALNESYKRQLADEVIKYGQMYLDITKPYTDFRSIAHLYVGMALYEKNGATRKVMIKMLRAVAEDPNSAKAWKMFQDIMKQLNDIVP